MSNKKPDFHRSRNLPSGASDILPVGHFNQLSLARTTTDHKELYQLLKLLNPDITNILLQRDISLNPVNLDAIVVEALSSSWPFEVFSRLVFHPNLSEKSKDQLALDLSLGTWGIDDGEDLANHLKLFSLFGQRDDLSDSQQQRLFEEPAFFNEQQFENRDMWYHALAAIVELKPSMVNNKYILKLLNKRIQNRRVRNNGIAHKQFSADWNKDGLATFVATMMRLLKEDEVETLLKTADPIELMLLQLRVKQVSK